MPPRSGRKEFKTALITGSDRKDKKMSLKERKDEIIKKLDLVIDKLMNLGMNEDSGNNSAIAAELFKRDSGIRIWDWPQGVGLYGLLKMQEIRPDEKIQAFLKNWFKERIEEGLPLKNINTTAPMLTLIDFLDEDPAYENLAKEWAEYLMNDLPKTEEGGFQHVTSGSGDGKSLILNEQQLWLDTIFMAVLFLNKMGNKYGRQDWIDEGIHQVLMHIRYLSDPRTGLFYHGWTFKERNNFGGVFWCRGDSWFTLGILDYLDTFKDNLQPAVRKYILDTFRAQIRALANLQAESGLWHTVLTNPATYEETSGTAAITAGILYGIRTGVLDPCYMETAQKAIGGILANIAEDGTVKNVSSGTPMGMNEDFYQNIKIAPMAYGQSLTIFALVEALKAM